MFSVPNSPVIVDIGRSGGGGGGGTVTVIFLSFHFNPDCAWQVEAYYFSLVKLQHCRQRTFWIVTIVFVRGKCEHCFDRLLKYRICPQTVLDFPQVRS